MQLIFVTFFLGTAHACDNEYVVEASRELSSEAGDGDLRSGMEIIIFINA